LQGGAQATDPDTLVRRMAAGNEDALKGLYDAVAPSVLGLLLRLLGEREEAEDVLQQVFLEAWTQARRFDPTRGSALAWLYQIARSRALDALRRRRTGPPAPIETGTSRSLDVAADRVDVTHALDVLDPIERRCIELAYYGGYTQRQVATLMRMPLGTVKTTTRRAIAKLRAVLGGGEERASHTASRP